MDKAWSIETKYRRAGRVLMISPILSIIFFRRGEAGVLIRATLFYLGLALITIIYLPISQLLWPFPIAFRFRIISKWSVFNLWWLKVTCNLTYEVAGREN